MGLFGPAVVTCVLGTAVFLFFPALEIKDLLVEVGAIRRAAASSKIDMTSKAVSSSKLCKRSQNSGVRRCFDMFLGLANFGDCRDILEAWNVAKLLWAYC